MHVSGLGLKQGAFLMMRVRLLVPLMILTFTHTLRADDAEEKAVAMVKKFKGNYVRDDKADGKPVTIVNLAGVKTLTDDDLKVIVAGFPQVKDLTVAESMVTDDGLKELKALSKLESLSLTRTKITDAGLKNLKDMKGLKMLHVIDTKVTEAGVKDLKKALPGCNIQGP
jgi:internalin A